MSATIPSAPLQADSLVNLAQALDVALRRAQGAAGDELSAASALRAAAQVCQGLLQDRWIQTQRDDARLQATTACRRVHYLSMEFLMGRALHNALSALGLSSMLSERLQAGGIQLADVLESEVDAALGNGGLGRLAACFLDSFAELGLPSFGYGLRYRYGMFAQRIVDGRQSEVPDDWMRDGNPWEVMRPEIKHVVGFGGKLVTEGGQRRWLPAERVVAHGGRKAHRLSVLLFR